MEEKKEPEEEKKDNSAEAPKEKKKRYERKKKKKSYTIKSRFDKKKRTDKRSPYEIMEEFLIKAGYDSTPKALNNQIIKVSIIIGAVLGLAVIIYCLALELPIYVIVVMLLISWTLGLISIYLISLLVVFAYLDIKLYQRTTQIEEVLPDFLQLTSANMSAGMTIDRALWLAVRPRFGVLAKEIEEIAKATTAGEDLNKALLEFSHKYNSRVLKESINLLIAGLDAGGEIGELLNKISTNIQEIKIMRKEISASVMTYVIFISAASVAAAPLLYALSVQLLGVVQSIAANVGPSTAGSGATMGFEFSFSGEGLDINDFKIFSMTVLGITAMMSAAIISVIRKGNVKSGLKNIPIFVGIALVIYILSGIFLGNLFSAFF